MYFHRREARIWPQAFCGLVHELNHVAAATEARQQFAGSINREVSLKNNFQAPTDFFKNSASMIVFIENIVVLQNVSVFLTNNTYASFSHKNDTFGFLKTTY